MPIVESLIGGTIMQLVPAELANLGDQ